MAARDTPNFKTTAKQSGTFPHAQETHRLAVVNFLPGNSAAIVFDLQSDLVVLLPQVYCYQRGAGMPDYIREGFLENPKQRRAQVLLQQLIS